MKIRLSESRVVSRFLSRRFHPKSRQLFPFYFSSITLRTDLLTFGVTGAVFKIAGEMRRLPAYFDNPGSRKHKWKNQPIGRPGVEHCHWFILPLLLATPTIQFSLDHKRWSHKQNPCSASDSISLIFTRSYHSTLLITTLTMTVKTS